MASSKSTILELQRSLCLSLDPKMIITISTDNTTIFISNISSDTFAKLQLITNTPAFSDYYFFKTLHVFIGSNLQPTKILGLDEIVNSRIRSSDLDGFINKQASHTPFSKGFKDGSNINDLVSKLSLLSVVTPDVPLDANLTFTLVMDPFWKKKHHHSDPDTTDYSDYWKQA